MIIRLIAFTLVFSVSIALAAPETQPKPKPTPQAKSSKKSFATKSAKKPQSGSQLPTQLPKKKKITVEFGTSSAEHTTTVVVRTPLPVEEAFEDQAAAEKSLKDSSTKIQAATGSQSPQTTPTPTSTPVAIVRPAPSPAPIAAAAPSPTPSSFAPTTQASIPPPREAKPVLVADPYPIPEPPIAASKQDSVSQSTAAVASQTSVESPKSFPEAARLFARTSYVDARYSGLSPELQNGQSTLAIGFEKDFPLFIGRAFIELGHGMDQAVTIQNTRSLIVRADFLHLFSGTEFLRPLVGGGVGIIDVNVRSYRSNPSGQTYIREHAHETTLLLSPFTGVRVNVFPANVDLTLEYTAVMTGNPTAFGGWTGALSVSFPL